MPGPKLCFQQQQRLLIAECWAPISKLLFKILRLAHSRAPLLYSYAYRAWLGDGVATVPYLYGEESLRDGTNSFSRGAE